MSMENKGIVQRWLDAAGSHDVAAMDDVCTPDYAHHDPGLSVQGADLETFKEILVGGLLGAFPDFSVEVAGMVAEGDRVAARWRFLGTHGGELPGHPPLPATGRNCVGERDVHSPGRGRQGCRVVGHLRHPGANAATRRGGVLKEGEGRGGVAANPLTWATPGPSPEEE